MGAAAALAMLASATSAPAAPGRGDVVGTVEAMRIRYSDSHVSAFLPDTLEIGVDGRAALRIGDNRGRPQLGAGLYGDALAESDVGPLRAALAAPEFAALAVPQGLPPGVPMRTLSVERAGGVRVERHGVGSAEPAAFTAPEALAVALMERLTARPLQVVVAGLEGVKVALPAAERNGTPILEATVTLRNPGTRPVRLAPLKGGEDPSQLQLIAEREAPPGAPERPDDLVFLEVPPARLEPSGTFDLAGPVLLPPQGAVTLRVRVPVRLRAGRHDVSVHLTTTLADDAGQELTRCEVHSVPVRVQLQERVRR